MENKIDKLLSTIDPDNKERIRRAMAYLDELDEETVRDITAFFFALVQEEVRAGLGLNGMDEQALDKYGDLPIFEMIDSLYQQSAGECYFCNQGIDANETEVNHDTVVCADCQLKLANFLKFVGADPTRVLALGQAPRNVQQSRFDPGKNKIGF